MKNRARILTAAMLASALSAVIPANAEACTPGDAEATPKTQDRAGFPAELKGHYALPDSATPTQLVVYAHGYRNISDSWVCHLLDAADKGAVAVAMDYRRTGSIGAPADHRGWFVKEGAQDSIAAAQHFLAAFPSITTVGLLGVSMGGNASGLAAAAGATRPGGAPLFDYWVDVEGATNVAETYLEASLVQYAGGTTGAYAAGAVADIEAEIGAAPDSDPGAFATGLADLAVLTHAPDIAASGLKGVAVVHGLDDGLVPYNQSRELVTALRALGMPTSMHTVLRRNDWQDPGSASDEGGTVLSSNVMGPLLGATGQPYTAPFAGHGWEGSSTHLVIKTGFDLLFALMNGTAQPANAEALVDGDLGTVTLI